MIGKKHKSQWPRSFGSTSNSLKTSDVRTNTVRQKFPRSEAKLPVTGVANGIPCEEIPNYEYYVTLRKRAFTGKVFTPFATAEIDALCLPLPLTVEKHFRTAILSY
jgi:hypothetical protein